MWTGKRKASAVTGERCVCGFASLSNLSFLVHSIVMFAWLLACLPSQPACLLACLLVIVSVSWLFVYMILYVEYYWIACIFVCANVVNNASLALCFLPVFGQLTSHFICWCLAVFWVSLCAELGSSSLHHIHHILHPASCGDLEFAPACIACPGKIARSPKFQSRQHRSQAHVLEVPTR